MIHFGHNGILIMMHSLRYDTFHDTFVVLGWKAETYNPGLWSGAPHSTCYCCLHSNHAQWVQQWRPHQSFQVHCFCVEFPRLIWIYWLSPVSICCSFLTIARDRTALYCIVISLNVSRYISSAQIYHCIWTTMNRFTPKEEYPNSCILGRHPGHYKGFHCITWYLFAILKEYLHKGSKLFNNSTHQKCISFFSHSSAKCQCMNT